MKQLAKALNQAFVIAGSIASFTLIGYYIDKYLTHTLPIFIILGSLCGVIISFWYLFTKVK